MRSLLGSKARKSYDFRVLNSWGPRTGPLRDGLVVRKRGGVSGEEKRKKANIRINDFIGK